MLLAQTKIAAAQEVLASEPARRPVPAPGADQLLPGAAARAVRGPDGQSHRLHREIITTAVVNDMVDRSGITFAFRLNEETGASVPDIAAAWLVARNVFDMAGFWAQVEALDGQVDTSVQILLWLEGRKLTERAARWLLHNRRPPFDIQATIDFLADGVLTVGSGLPKLLTGSDLTGFEERRDVVHLAGRAARTGRAGRRHGPGLLGVRHRGHRRAAPAGRSRRPPRSTSTWPTGCRSPGCGTGSPRCPATTGGTRWRGPRSATTCTARTRRWPRTCSR